jgi:hypothetical protein
MVWLANRIDTIEKERKCHDLTNKLFRQKKKTNTLFLNIFSINIVV